VIQLTVSWVELINFYTVEGLYKLTKLPSLSNTIQYYASLCQCPEQWVNHPVASVEDKDDSKTGA